MPKGKRKGKYEHRRTEQGSSSDEDMGIDMAIDNISENSVQSDLRSNHEEADNEAQEKFEEKVLELVETLNSRANAARAAAFSSLRSALQRRPLSHVLSGHRATLADHVSKALRRGKDGEKRAAAAVANLLALQIGEEGVEEYVQEIRPALLVAALDRGATLETRVDACNALTALCYMLEEDITEVLEIMKSYETIFSGSYLKGDGSVKVSGPAISEGTWHAAALDGWALLLTLLSPAHARDMLPELRRLSELLAAPTVEVRMAAGTALALVYERMTADSPADRDIEAEVERALPLLEELARDSHKYRAKKERKAQRATFRDILKYLEEDVVPSEVIRVGKESVRCSTWREVAGYSAVAGALGGALPVLAGGPALRAVLGLPDLPPAPRRAATRLERQLQNAATCKARTVARNKNRDKRSAALTM